MRREGSPWTGVGAVFRRELADNLSSVRMRFLEVLVVLTGTAAVYAAIGEIRNLVAEDRFVFLRIFTVAREPLPSFITFLAFLIPIVAIALAFDSVNGEFNACVTGHRFSSVGVEPELAWKARISGLR